MLARVFLAATFALFSVLYAVPLLFAPLRWARALRWTSIPIRASRSTSGAASVRARS